METSDRRFWRNVDTSGDCWEWTASTGSHGYGQIMIDGKAQTAHRASWEMHNGPIPPSLFVLHRCDNRRCVNPAHLFVGTHSDNMRDMVAKGRHGKPMALLARCPQGHAYDAANTAIRPNGWRVRRTCSRAKWRRWKAKNVRQQRAIQSTTTSSSADADDC